jgi:hypothetical protein
MTNNFFQNLNPQMQNNINSLFQQAMQSGNPQQFLMQKYGNDAMFQQGMKIFNEQGINGLTSFIQTKLK